MKPADPQRISARLSEMAERLPWWGGLLLALAAYAILHPIAVLQMPAPTGTLDVVAGALAQLLVLLAGIGQYLLPLTFLVAAAVSGFERWRRDELRESVTQDTSGSILRGLPWRDFELLVGDAFRLQDYKVCIPQTDSRAGSRALELTKDGKRFLVDCTDWRSWKAGASAVRGLHERMQGADAEGGFAVTSGMFTPEAKHFAADVDIRLIDGRRLKELVRAEEKPANGNPWPVGGELRAFLSRWRELVPAVRRPSDLEPRTREPSIALSRARTLDADAPAIHSSAIEEPAATDDTETAAGQELAALIRAERRIAGEIQLSAPPVTRREANRHHPRVARTKLRARNIADAAGMILTIGVLWGTYQWFLALPGETADTPWALLGASSDSDVLMRRLQGLTRTRSTARLLEGERPLGQYQFGPPPGYLARAQPPTPEEELVEVYHSLRDLEAAFDAKYVPPPECYAYESSNQMVKCGNHRIRARRTFIAGGGMVTPMLLGSWEEPREVLTEARTRDWREYDQDEWQQDSTREWDQDRRPDTTQEWNQDWQPDTAQEWDQDWRQEWTPKPAAQSDRDWQRERIQQPAQDWPQDQTQGSEEDWRPDWGSELAPEERRHWVDEL